MDKNLFIYFIEKGGSVKEWMPAPNPNKWTNQKTQPFLSVLVFIPLHASRSVLKQKNSVELKDNG